MEKDKQHTTVMDNWSERESASDISQTVNQSHGAFVTVSNCKETLTECRAASDSRA